MLSRDFPGSSRGCQACPCHCVGRSFRAACPPLSPRRPRFAILAAVDFLRRSIGTGKRSDPQNSQKILFQGKHSSTMVGTSLAAEWLEHRAHCEPQEIKRPRGRAEEPVVRRAVLRGARARYHDHSRHDPTLRSSPRFRVQFWSRNRPSKTATIERKRRLFSVIQTPGIVHFPDSLARLCRPCFPGFFRNKKG